MSVLLGETYAVTTFEEVEEAKIKRENSVKDFRSKYENYLMTCLCNAGLAHNKVRVKKNGDIGVLRVEENRGSISYPYEIKFYPLKKDGEVSLKSRYVSEFWGWKIKSLVEELQKTFEPVGDDNAD